MSAVARTMVGRAPEGVPSAPRIWDALQEACAVFAARTAVQEGTRACSYQDLWARVETNRQWLQDRVAAGPIVLVPRNDASWVALVFGAIGSGRVPLLADPVWTAAELEHVVARAAARAVALPAGCEAPKGLSLRGEADGHHLFAVEEPKAAESIQLRDDTAFGRFTSGTTGFPRCLQFSDAAALAAARSWQEAAGLHSNDRVLCLATLNNGLAFNTSLLSVFLTGGLLAFHGGRVLPRSLEKSFDAIDPTVFVAFPFAYELLVKHEAGRVPARLRLAVSSAARLAPAVREAWLSSTGLPICDYYGVAEVGPCTFNDGSRPDSVGQPLPGVSFTITDEAGRELPPGEAGLIRIGTRSMASAYLDREGPPFSASLDEQGRYVSRDLGCLSATGHLVLGGRQGRMVNVAGRKIDPLEVEGVLRQLPGVRDALVCGEESPDRTVLAAYIESDSLTREQLMAFLVTRVASYKIPQAVVIVPRLPRSSTGKLSVGRMRSAHDWRDTCRPPR